MASLLSYKIFEKKVFIRDVYRKPYPHFSEWLNEEKDGKSQPKMFLQKTFILLGSSFYLH
jgi:hypothetical protein